MSGRASATIGTGGAELAPASPRSTVAVVIAGGGTGGHTSPGIAVAGLLRERGVSCAWIGSTTGVEARVVPAAEIPFHAIPTGKLRRYWSWRNVLDLTVNVPAGLARATWLLRRLRPRVVFATGGFVALPGVLAAAVNRIPVVIHEQTTVPGLANRLSARFARHIAVTFAEGRHGFPPDRVVVTGNPLRLELGRGTREGAAARFGLVPGVPLVYVTGGAQGSRPLNRAVGAALPALLESAQLIHQCGDNPGTGDRAWLEERRAALPERMAQRYTVVPFVGPELADIFAATSLVVGRSGAGTVNECCHLGLPALYVPMPGGGGNEQMANARLVERAGGCAVLPQRDLTPDRLVDSIRTLLADPARLADMGQRARSLAIPDATTRLTTLILSVANL